MTVLEDTSKPKEDVLSKRKQGPKRSKSGQTGTRKQSYNHCTISGISKDSYDKIVALAHFSGTTISKMAEKAIDEYASKYSQDIVDKYKEYEQKQRELKEHYMKDLMVPVVVDNPYGE